MHRRAFLATLSAGVAGLAGCNSCVNRFTLHVQPVDPSAAVDLFVETPGESGQALAERVVENGSLQRPVGEESDGAVLPDGSRVQVNGSYYRISRSANESIVTYNATTIASNRSAFGQQLLADRDLTLELGSDEQRSIFQQAIQEGEYETCDPDEDSAFMAVVDEIEGHPSATGDNGFENWFVRFQGHLYQTWVVEVAA